MSKIINHYKIETKLGNGSYGDVYKSTHQVSGEVFAIKQICKKKFIDVPKLQELTMNEIQILSKINSENIIRYIETLQTQNNYYFVYEYCNNGTLEDFQKEQLKRGPITDNWLDNILKQLFKAFKTLQENNILHRDLKPQNILFNNNILKVGDFGFCKQINEQQNQLAQSQVGSPLYMAPEILEGQKYNHKCDIWSLGIMLYELIEGCTPFQMATNIIQLLKIIKQDQKLQFNNIYVSDKYKNIVRQCLKINQSQRIEWTQLFQMFSINDNPIHERVLNSINIHNYSNLNLQNMNSPLNRMNSPINNISSPLNKINSTMNYVSSPIITNKLKNMNNINSPNIVNQFCNEYQTKSRNITPQKQQCDNQIQSVDIQQYLETIRNNRLIIFNFIKVVYQINQIDNDSNKKEVINGLLQMAVHKHQELQTKYIQDSEQIRTFLMNQNTNQQQTNQTQLINLVRSDTRFRKIQKLLEREFSTLKNMVINSSSSMNYDQQQLLLNQYLDNSNHQYLKLQLKMYIDKMKTNSVDKVKTNNLYEMMVANYHQKENYSQIIDL